MNPLELARGGTEHGLQQATVAWARKAAVFGYDVAWDMDSYSTGNNPCVGETENKGIPELKLLFAIPNGGKRTPATAARLKAEGVLAGVPDLFLPVPRDQSLGLFIEMKTRRGVLSAAQEVLFTKLRDQGFEVIVERSWVAAATTIEAYLEMH